MTSISANTLLALILALGASPAISEEDPSFTHRDSFIAAHPSLFWLREGVRAHERARYSEAMTALRRSAWHADKTAQAMISQMLWNGEGVARDRALAYVWADLAAERGYLSFVATREQFWNALDADERRAALAAGPAIFDEYADAVAKPREERALRTARMRITGSRLGHVGTLAVNEILPWGVVTTDGSIYYADKYWKPEPYWQWRDHAWKKLPEGKVEVGPIQIPPED
ncbi:MAG: sel1 repeat family protein [Xanthomonadales bacterium]|nr:sel1 repeat family protein [Xanthomonadales bacterium]